MLRLMLISDSPLFGQGLAQMLTRDRRLDVVSLAASCGQILNLERDHQPDAVLVDMGMSGAMETLEELAAFDGKMKVIALGLSGEEKDIVTCAELGIAGYLCRDESLEDLVATVENAVRGELRCSRRIAGALIRRVAELAHHPPGDTTVALTPREIQIARLLDEGLTNKDIAQKLAIEVGTVKNHVHHLLDKLDAQTRGEAAARARKLRIIRHRRTGTMHGSAS